MPVVDTNQSFNTGDTVTSTSLNNIMDQSIFVPGAIVAGDGLLVTAGGQMTLATITSGKIGSGEVKTLNIEDASITTAKIVNANVTQSKLGSNVVGNGPAFRATSLATTIPNNTFTNVLFSDTATDTFDTNSNFSSNTFTPTVAGYYQINGSISYTVATDGAVIAISKNGAVYSYGSPQTPNCVRATVSDIVYLNGTGDFVNLAAYHSSGTNKTIAVGQGHFSGCLIRSA